MSNYLFSIKTAVIVFPILAFLVTLPYVLVQYHKYGSVNKLRTLIVYSFILYLLALYFLVILPLPDKGSVVYKDGMVRLVPFGFVSDLINESSFVVSDLSTYVTALKEPCFYTVAFNILMTIPFGMYLRYYFNCDFKKTVLVSFLLSLFFEVTQITGLYFIYPYPYRVFDVDDLIMNTMGGIIGYLLIGSVKKWLPSRNEIDEKSYRDGESVSGLRRIVMFCMDTFLVVIVIFIPSSIPMKITLFLIYFGILPRFMGNQTLAGKFLNVRVDIPRVEGIVQPVRMLIIYLYYFGIPYLYIWLVVAIKNTSNLSVLGNLYLLFIMIVGILVFYIVNVVKVLKCKNVFYDTMFKVSYVSTISRKNTSNC